MTKFALEILDVLITNEATTSMQSMSVRQLYDAMPEQRRKSYSTIYRHLINLTEKGYVDNALDDGLSSTYIITSTGKQLHDSLYK